MSRSARQLNRRKFITHSASLAAGTVIAAKFGPALRAAAAAAAPDFQSNWNTCLDRVWLGAEFWANPMQDWRVAGGRIECVKEAPNRNVHTLTRQLGSQPGALQMSVCLGRIGGAFGKGKGSVGFRLGILGTLRDYPELRDYRNNLWPAPGAGLDAGLTAQGGLFIGNFRAPQANNVPVNAEMLELRLNAAPASDAYKLTLSAHDAATGKALGEVTRADIKPEQLVGNLALVANFGVEGGGGGKGKAKGKAGGGPDLGNGQFWFSDWRFSGSKLAGRDDQTFGPILFSQYTLSQGVMKLTAQMPPLGAQDSRTVRLQIKDGAGWKTIGEEKIHPAARTATFRIANWNDKIDVPYRLAYTLKSTAGAAEHYWAGTVRRDPVDQPVLTVADVSCNIHTVFPNALYVRNMARLNPDLLAFVGDQFYENCGGYGTQREPLGPAIIDYLRKWYFHGWTWRELMRDRPTVSLPDDHDVYQGNLWGEGGEGRKTTQEAGGYDLVAEWVNVVHRTQTAHHPDPYDPTPGKRGTTHYYGPLTYGRVSFAILADRQYKSGPEGKVPPTGDRGDHVKDPNYDPKTADLPGLQMLGEKQMRFLREWAADWRGADMKAVISQTIFSAMATTHGGGHEVLVADYDANGWPQTPRNQALREIRKAFAFHLAGDQHLPAVIHYGIDAHGDGPVAFAGPAVNVGYPRWWEPEKTRRNRLTGAQGVTGNFFDHFGHPLTVIAVKNAPYELPKPVLEQVDAKASGLGVVGFDKPNRKIKIECWPYLADPTKPGTEMPGWPVVVSQLDNYGRQTTAHLPKLAIVGVKNPVVQVIDEQSQEVVYALRIAGQAFQPHVFAPGKYTVKVSEPESGKAKTLTGLQALAGNTATLEVKF